MVKDGSFDTDEMVRAAKMLKDYRDAKLKDRGLRCHYEKAKAELEGISREYDAREKRADELAEMVGTTLAKMCASAPEPRLHR